MQNTKKKDIHIINTDLNFPFKQSVIGFTKRYGCQSFKIGSYGHRMGHSGTFLRYVSISFHPTLKSLQNDKLGEPICTNY